MKLTKQEQKEFAQQHINELFRQANLIYSKNKKLADRYIKLALDMRNKYKIKLNKKQKSNFCKKCHSFLIPGQNSIVRIKNKMILYHCKECGYIRRFNAKL
jgi:ribonuclease P protein subunit RPR2